MAKLQAQGDNWFRGAAGLGDGWTATRALKRYKADDDGLFHGIEFITLVNKNTKQRIEIDFAGVQALRALLNEK